MLKGVVSVTPGYANSFTATLNEKVSAVNASEVVPNYESVSSGNTNYAEVVEIKYDSTLVSINDLLTVFFGSHDPTTVNRQGADVGTQYRSVIFTTNDEQTHIVNKFIDNLNKSSEFGSEIVTDVESLGNFYEAENYHKDYYTKNKGASYCQIVINPKLEKVQKKFAKLLNNGK